MTCTEALRLLGSLSFALTKATTWPAAVVYALMLAAGLGGPAVAQSYEQLQKQCTDHTSTLDLRLEGCTAIIQAIEAGRESTGRLAVTLTNRGSVFTQKGQLELALQDYSEAIRLSPKSAWTFANRGGVYAMTGEHDLAIQDLDQAIQLDPAHVPALYNRGFSYAQKAQHERAIQDYNLAILLDPKVVVRGGRGLSYLATGQIERAILDFEAALRIAPQSAHILYSRGIARQRSGDVAGATADIAAAKALAPDISERMSRYVR